MVLTLLRRKFLAERTPSIAPDPSSLLPRFPQDIEPATGQIIDRVQPFTMTSPVRIACLCRSVAYLEKNQIPGDIVECGVWKGGSMMAAALTLQKQGSTRRNLFLFDTFAGMTVPTEWDRDLAGRSAQDWLASAEPAAYMVRAICPLAEVRENLLSTGYDSRRIFFIEGKVEDTLLASAPPQIALLRLDTDWYASTRHELVHLFPRLSPGGILIVDDYGHWQGARQAVDEYLSQHEPALTLHAIDYTGRLAVKPGKGARP
jgi:O-methyltransferase